MKTCPRRHNCTDLIMGWCCYSHNYEECPSLHNFLVGMLEAIRDGVVDANKELDSDKPQD